MTLASTSSTPSPGQSRRALVLGAAMAATAGLAVWARQRASGGRQAVPPRLQASIPMVFEDWQFVPTAPQIVNPQTQQILDAIYSEIVSRTYVDKARYHIMMSVAYGSDQRGGLEAHKPEVCYPAQGFVLQDQRDETIQTPHGALQVRRLRTAQGARQEPLTYWFAMAETQNASALERRMTRLRAALSGSIPDGILMRVSSIDPDAQRAWRMQDAFIASLLAALPPSTRMRVMGLGTGLAIGG